MAWPDSRLPPSRPRSSHSRVVTGITLRGQNRRAAVMRPAPMATAASRCGLLPAGSSSSATRARAEKPSPAKSRPVASTRQPSAVRVAPRVAPARRASIGAPNTNGKSSCRAWSGSSTQTIAASSASSVPDSALNPGVLRAGCSDRSSTRLLSVHSPPVPRPATRRSSAPRGEVSYSGARNRAGRKSPSASGAAQRPRSMRCASSA